MPKFNDGGGGVSSLVYTNVKDHGATGNGTTNDTTAIHAARDAAGVRGRLYFPTGTYIVSGLNANVAGQTWEISKNATVKLANGANAHLFRPNASGVTITGEGTLDGNRSNNTGDWCGILNEVTGLSDVTVSGITIKSTRSQAVRFGPGGAGANLTRIKVVGTEIYDCQAGVEYNWECKDSAIKDNVIHDLFGAGGEFGMGNGVWVGNNSTRLLCTGNRVYNTLRMGIEVWSGCHKSIVSNNIVDNVDSMGISVGTGDDCIVVNNQIDGCSDCGIEIAANTNKTLCQGNQINNVAGVGISLDGSDDAVVIGNMVDTCTGVYGMGLQSVQGGSATKPSKRCVISANQFANCEQRAILLNANSDICVISNNIFRNNAVEDIYVYQSRNVTISNNVIDSVGVTNASSINAIYFNSLAGEGRSTVTGNQLIGDKVAYHITWAANEKNLWANNTHFSSAGVLLNDYGPTTKHGNGSPEGVITGRVGDEYRRLDGGTGTTQYIKESGANTNTGWVAISSGGGGGGGGDRVTPAATSATTSRTLLTTEEYVRASGTITLTLPDASAAHPNGYILHNIDGTLKTLAAASGDNINGLSTLTSDTLNDVVQIRPADANTWGIIVPAGGMDTGGAVSVAAATGVTSATLGAGSTARSGKVTVVIGGSNITGALVFTLTVSLPAAPKAVIFGAGNSNAASDIWNMYADASTLSATTIQARMGTSPLSASATYVFFYTVDG